MKTIGQRELRNDNAKVIDAVVAGETFMITRNGHAVAELQPARSGRRTFVPRQDLEALLGAAVRIDPTRFRADVDAQIDQDW